MTDTKVNFYQESFKSYWNHIVNWQGRATRAEFWYPVLTMYAVLIVLSLLSLVEAKNLLSFVNFIAFLSVGVRRLHDCGRSAHMLWIVPLSTALLGVLVSITFACLSYFGYASDLVIKIRSVVFICLGFLLVGSIPLLLLIYGFIPSQKKDNKYGAYQK